MSTPESLVLSKCKDMLSKLEAKGWVTHFTRLNVGLHRNMQGYIQSHGKPGESDLLAFVPVEETMWIMLFEVKREDGGRQSESQMLFENKFIGFNNVIYRIITDAKQIEYLIHKIKGIPFNSAKYEESIRSNLWEPQPREEKAKSRGNVVS